MRILASALAVTAATTAALFLGTTAATAEPAPSVVGLSETDAVAALNAAGVPHTITNRSGNVSGTCTVTGQRDRGHRIDTDLRYDRDDRKLERVETPVWRGVGLTVVCR